MDAAEISSGGANRPTSSVGLQQQMQQQQQSMSAQATAAPCRCYVHVLQAVQLLLHLCLLQRLQQLLQGYPQDMASRQQSSW